MSETRRKFAAANAHEPDDKAASIHDDDDGAAALVQAHHDRADTEINRNNICLASILIEERKGRTFVFDDDAAL
jgi:hypothetical protein